MLDVADARHVTVTSSQLADARTNLAGADLAGDVRDPPGAGGAGRPLQLQLDRPASHRRPGAGHHAVVVRRPTGAVRRHCQRAAGRPRPASAPARSDLEAYFQRHLAAFDTACWTVGAYSSQSDAQAAEAEVASGTPFSQVAAKATQGGPETCEMLPIIVVAELPSTAKVASLPTGAVSAPIDVNGTYVLVQITSRTPTAYSKAAPVVAEVVQQAGAKATRRPSRRRNAAPR